MPGKPADLPPSSRRATSPVAGASLERGQLTERIGPVAIARHRKDDGRALILYSRADLPIKDLAEEPTANSRTRGRRR